MKKILLLSLAVLSPQVFAESIELQCRNYGSEGRFTQFLIIDKDIDEDGYNKFLSRHYAYFDKDGKARSFSQWASVYNASWGDKYILVKGSGNITNGYIDRETLEYDDRSNSLIGRRTYECEITNNLKAKFKRWEKEAKAHKKAENAAQKAKNKI